MLKLSEGKYWHQIDNLKFCINGGVICGYVKTSDVFKHLYEHANAGDEQAKEILFNTTWHASEFLMASEDGWILFNQCIIAVTDSNKFMLDEEATNYVVEQGKAGNVLCQKALIIINRNKFSDGNSTNERGT